MKPARLRVLVVVMLTGGFAVLPALSAQAHPLGNFTVNHFDGLTLRPDSIDVLSVLDTAELPTRQEQSSIDTDDNGTMSAGELTAYGATQCVDLVEALDLRVGGESTALTLASSSLTTVPGAAGLPTLRLTCDSTAVVALDAATTVDFADESYQGDRVGWHEITATGDGVRLVGSPVPAASVSDELRTYPNDLLSSPLAVKSVSLEVEPGAGASTTDGTTSTKSANPFTRAVAAGDALLERTVGNKHLTPLVGLAAALLSVLLGAGHALLPGHGKTVMAAYLAGRRGSRRDALVVGATVTATHTVSVLVLGLLITVSAALVGEQALRWLGIVSGLLIASVGAVLLRDSLRARHATHADSIPAMVAAGAPAIAAMTTAAGHLPTHSHAAADHHDHEHDHGHEHGHDHEHDHEHGAGEHHQHAVDGSHTHGWWAGHSHGEATHTHGPAAPSALDSGVRPYGRKGLLGMGIAGGLVPSPSALIVLLGSIGLGRTGFGIVLVLLYGLGMAGTLTAVGLLLVRVRGRLEGMGVPGRIGSATTRIVAVLPTATAVLVLVVGVGLAIRGYAKPI